MKAKYHFGHTAFILGKMEKKTPIIGMLSRIPIQLWALSFVASLFLGAGSVQAVHIGVDIHNPDWFIRVTDFGYSDGLFDKRTGFEGREYLSGEWAAAVGYDQIQTNQGITDEAMWLENSNTSFGGGDPTFDFEAPEWQTNSTFVVVSPMAATDIDVHGHTIAAESTISNGDLKIRQILTMVATPGGIDQGTTPASSAGTPRSIISNPHILSQTYEITNISGGDISNLQLYQFLHGLHSESAVYDDRLYAGAPPEYDEYHYDTTLQGVDPGVLVPGFIHDDVISFHSKVEPTAQEVGIYDRNGPYDAFGKPLAEIHLDVEADALDGTDLYVGVPGIASGAQRYNLASSLTPDAMVSIELLLSISTQTTVIPLPAAAWMGLGLLGVLGATRLIYRRRLAA